MIISVGYRVKSRRGTQFRIWANSVLKEYLIKGYAVKNNLIQERYDELKALVDTLGRTRDGLAAARARGRLGGRPKVDEKKIQQALAMYDAKDIPIKDILETTGISRATLYLYLRTRKG